MANIGRQLSLSSLFLFASFLVAAVTTFPKSVLAMMPYQYPASFRIYGGNGGIEFDPEVLALTSLQGWTLKTVDRDEAIKVAAMDESLTLGLDEHLLFDLSAGRYAIGTYSFFNVGFLRVDIVHPELLRDGVSYQLGGELVSRQGMPGVPEDDLTLLFGNPYAVALYDEADDMQFFVQTRIKDTNFTVIDDSLTQEAVDAGLWTSVDDYLEYDLRAWWYEVEEFSTAMGPGDFVFFSFPEPSSLSLLCLGLTAVGFARSKHAS